MTPTPNRYELVQRKGQYHCLDTVTGQIVEGGFWGREAAVACVLLWRYTGAPRTAEPVDGDDV